MTLRSDNLDPEHVKYIFGLAAIAKCSCGKVGIGRNSGRWSGGKWLLKFKCSGCGKDYSERQIEELIVREPSTAPATQTETAPVVAAAKAKPVKQPRWRPDQRVNTTGLLCPTCGAEALTGRGKRYDIFDHPRQDYKCSVCGKRTTKPKKREGKSNEVSHNNGSPKG